MDASLQSLTREQLRQLNKETVVDLTLVALARIHELEQQAAQQNDRIQKLEDQLARIVVNHPVVMVSKSQKQKACVSRAGKAKGVKKGIKDTRWKWCLIPITEKFAP